jgi:hypothetical protein
MLPKFGIKRKFAPHWRTCHAADFGQMWPENDAHDWSSEELVMQWTLAKCGKKMMPLVGGLSLTADLGPNVVLIVPLVGGLCHAEDFDQMWSKMCPSLEDFVSLQTSTKCSPKCALCWRTLSHCGLRLDVAQTCAPCWRTLSHCRL